jgi:hypothetical protein
MWQSCSEKDLNQLPRKCEEVSTIEASDTLIFEELEASTIKKSDVPNSGFLSIFIFDNDESILSGYQLVFSSIENGLKKENLKDLGFWVSFSFLLYALISLLLLVFVFIKKRMKVFLMFSAINLGIIMVAYFLCLHLSDEITQIKYGFYLLIINSLLILWSNFWEIAKQKKVDLF